jgi:hypothetical protein
MADLSKIKLNGTEYDLKDTIARMLANTQADWNQTDTTALDYIKNKPVEEEPAEYTISFVKVIAGQMNKFMIDNPKEDTEEMKADFLSGNVKINRIFNLSYDPINALPDTTAVFPDYEFCGISGNFAYYQRIIAFDNTHKNSFLDVLMVLTSNFSCQHYYI